MSEDNTNPAPVVDAPVTPAPVSPTTGTPTGTNGLAVAAMVIGIVAVVTGWIPFWGVLTGITALVLGIIGLRKATGKGMSITGIATGGVALLYGTLVTVGFVSAIIITTSNVSTGVEKYNKEMNSLNAETQELIDSKKNFPKGATAIFADTYEVTVDSVQVGYKPGEYYTPKEGKEYVLVDLTIKNITDEQDTVPYNLQIVENGVARSASFVPSERQLKFGELAADATITGTLVYEVTKGASDLKLQYNKTVLDKNFKAHKLAYTLEI